MSGPNLNQQFEECLKRAKDIVSSYRAEAPEGCDPQNSWVYVGVTVVSTAGNMIAANGQKKQAQQQAANQQKQFSNAQKYLSDLSAGKMGSLEEMFGSKLDPEAFLYEPVDISQSQLDTIQGNIGAFPSALQLTNMVNPSIWKNDLSRIRSLMPGYDNSRDLYLGATKKLLSGELPFQDVEDIVSNRSSLAGSLGSPGGSRNATLRDLGLSRMDAINQGGSMFQQFIQMAEAISPVGSQMRPQQMMFTPQERLQADILQRSLEQQGRASAAMAEAMPDPAQNALANAGIGLNMAQLGMQSPSTAGMGQQALGQSLSSAAGLFGSMYGMNRAPSMNGGYGAPAQSLYTGAAPRSVAQSPFNMPSYGGQTSAYGTSSFTPTAYHPLSTPYANAMPYSGGGSTMPPNSLFPSGSGAPNFQYTGTALGQYGQGWYRYY